MESVPIIDVRDNGIGDEVVASWIVHSAAAVGRRVRVNTRDRSDVARLLGVPEDCLTTDESPEGAATPGNGEIEGQLARTNPVSRFDAFCRSVNLPHLTPVRPPYCEQSEHREWASEQWRKVNADPSVPRVLLFPEAAWPLRAWPKAYFMDLASDLFSAGWAVAAMGGTQESVNQMPCYWWGGFGLRYAAAMAKAATVVVANDSGPSHLASTLGVRTIAICGPTDPWIVFGHEPNVQAAVLDPALLPCVKCHFLDTRGYRSACTVGGCQAMMRLDPASVSTVVRRAVLEQREPVRCETSGPGRAYEMAPAVVDGDEGPVRLRQRGKDGDHGTTTCGVP